MSYCIKCGVELSEYMKECPLCKTKVADRDDLEMIANTDYPDYKISPRGETKRVNSLFVGKLLSMLFFNYAMITMVINILVDKKISWSMIPVVSLLLVWFGVAYPFLRKKNSFFKLFTFDSIAVVLYLLSLNFIISRDFIWARYACLGVALLWSILAGFFLSEKIRKILPITIYYILSAILFFVITTLFIDNRLLEIQLIVPITLLLLIISIVSYFVIVARAKDALGLVSVILFDISTFCLALDILLSQYFRGTLMPSWSIFVIVVTIPLFVTFHTIRKGRELRSIISKKLHR